VTVAETPDISTSELSPESELSPVTLPNNVVADVQQNEVSEEVEEATPLEQTDATSADESEEAIASLTPVEIAPEATEVVADEVAPQLLRQGMVETTPDPWAEPSIPANVDAGECENPATPTEVAPEAVPASVEDEIGVNDEPAAKEKQWAWNKTTGESLGEVLSINPIKGAKIRRSGELPRYAKFYPLQEITFDNPVVQGFEPQYFSGSEYSMGRGGAVPRGG
jgi:hypothetical protein